MNTDELTKLIFIISISISILVIAFGLLRVLWILADNLKDAQKTTRNMGLITDNLINEQKMLDEILESFRTAGKVTENVFMTIANLGNLTNVCSRKLINHFKKDENE